MVWSSGGRRSHGVHLATRTRPCRSVLVSLGSPSHDRSSGTAPSVIRMAFPLSRSIPAGQTRRAVRPDETEVL